MKIISFLNFFAALILSIHAFGQNTITTSSPVQTSFCAGGNLIVQYTSTGTFPLGCNFTAQLSDGLGNFGSPVTIGSMPINSGIIAGTIPSSTAFGVNYRVRVVADNPATIGSTSGTPIIITSTAVSATIVTTPSTAVCQGDTVSLWVTYNASYHWSTGETTQTIHVADSGTYTVTVTNFLTSCEVTSNPVHITIHPTPHVDFGPDAQFCDGQVDTLNAGAGFTSYQWSDSSTVQTVYAHNTGTYSVVVHDNFGCIGGDTIHILFHPNPNVNLGPDTNLCGNTMMLHAGAGFSTYNWNNGLSFNPNLLVANPGTYFVYVVDSNGCSARDTILVNIHAMPVINLGNDLSACGNSLVLNAGTGYSAYDWNNGMGLNQYFPVSTSGDYFVKITDQYGCNNFDTIHVDMHPLPEVNLGSDMMLSSYDSLMLDAGAGYASYHWSTGATTEAIQIHAWDYPLGIATIIVTVYDNYGCYNSDEIKLNIVSSTWNNEFDLYPNPFHDDLRLNSILNLADAKPLLYDMLGRYSAPEYSFDNSNMIIHRGDIAKGCYVLFLNKNDQLKYVGKVVIY
ncbi:MAG: hypothetical protein WCH34_06515 [Bacteroidota bacterium]